MPRLDVYRMPGGSGRGYVVDVQADLLSDLTTRVVVPLLPEQDFSATARDLNPVFEVEGVRHVLLPQAIAAVPRRLLRDPVHSLLPAHDQVLRALDTLLLGF